MLLVLCGILVSFIQFIYYFFDVIKITLTLYLFIVFVLLYYLLNRIVQFRDKNELHGDGDDSEGDPEDFIFILYFSCCNIVIMI